MTGLQEARRERGDADVHAVSAWILRGGVTVSAAAMLLGLALSFVRGAPTVAQMTSERFAGGAAAVVRGALALQGAAWIELGILLLVLTPIARVAGSLVIFAAEEHDWLYAGVTFGVLALTLLSLLVLG